MCLYLFFILYSEKYWFTAVPGDFTVKLLHAKPFLFCSFYKSDVSENLIWFPLPVLVLEALNNIPLFPLFEHYMITQIIGALS